MDQGFDLPPAAATIYVNAAATATSPNGSAGSPYRTIAAAVQGVTITPVDILVAVGDYAENRFSLPPGARLRGGYTPSNWTRTPSTRSTLRFQVEAGTSFVDDLEIEGDSSKITLIEGFDLYGARYDHFDRDRFFYGKVISILNPARAAFRDNRFYSSLMPAPDGYLGDNMSHGGYQAGTMITTATYNIADTAVDAVVEVTGNQFLVPFEHPEMVSSYGIGSSACARITDNTFTGIGTAIHVGSTPMLAGERPDERIAAAVAVNAVVIKNNRFLQGFGGITVDGGSPRIEGNRFALSTLNYRLSPSLTGTRWGSGVFPYESSHPIIHDNDFDLTGGEGWGAGISDYGPSAATLVPVELTDNRFLVCPRNGSEPFIHYIYHGATYRDDPHPVLYFSNTTDEVNGLSIPTNRGNIVTVKSGCELPTGATEQPKPAPLNSFVVMPRR